MRRAIPAALTAGVVLAGLACTASKVPNEAARTTLELAPAPELDPVGFARANEARALELPADLGPHGEFQTEWWYYTGNLKTAPGEHLGYQLTFFRRGLAPGSPGPGTGLRTHQIYLAHLAVTDVAAGTHGFAERFSRGAAGLAGAQGTPFGVWLEDWGVESTNEDGSAVRLRARGRGLALDLSLEATKPLVAHGYRGLSAKSEEPGNASYYLSYTRMATRGTLEVAGRNHGVEGESWFDHEWSTSAMGPDALGWDWFSLQLSDGRELMFFQIRREDGGFELASSGTLVEPDGSTTRLRLSDVDVGVTARWESPRSGAVYPARWVLAVPSKQIELVVEPWLADQELSASFTYWEGAVRLRGSSGGMPVTGNGYVEMTGYASSMQGVL